MAGVSIIAVLCARRFNALRDLPVPSNDLPVKLVAAWDQIRRNWITALLSPEVEDRRCQLSMSWGVFSLYPMVVLVGSDSFGQAANSDRTGPCSRIVYQRLSRRI
jgi:hypothetical protein